MSDPLALADWRRSVFDLYRDIRDHADPAAAHALWRETKDRLFHTHAVSPLDADARSGFGGLRYYDYDPALRHVVEVEPASGPMRDVPVGADGMVRYSPLARTSGLEAAFGSELTLYWIAGYGGGLFLPFRDATCGTETFGAGRYLLDTIKGADLGQEGNALILDFNFAYNPSCSYSDAWVCPLSPVENTLSECVRGGERLMSASPA